MREEGGSTGSTGHDSVIAVVLGLLLHGDAVGPGGEVRLVLDWARTNRGTQHKKAVASVRLTGLPSYS